MNPATRKRLQRFRRFRRAYISAWCLAAVCLLTLGADLLCNNKPILMRFKGRYYFPLLRFYPESEFLPKGKATRPDYKALNALSVFRDQDANFMIFPPVPFGPRETIREASIKPEGHVTVTFLPIPRVSGININSNLIIQSSRAAAAFFPVADRQLQGKALNTFWPITSALQQALNTRFHNAASPRFQTTVSALSAPRQKAVMSLPTYNPRAQPPATLRLFFRLPKERQPSRCALTLDKRQEPVGNAPLLWEALPPDVRTCVKNQATASRHHPVDTLRIDVANQQYQVVCDSSITWPYPPVQGHWLGIDSAGRDVLSRIVHGLRVSLSFGILLVVSSMFIGIIIGAIQGYYGGLTDITGQRLIEIWSSIPFLYVMILLGSIYGAHFWLLLLVYAVFNWIGISYYMRGEVLRLRNHAFVDAARVLGVRSTTIIFRHILPNAITPIITFIPFSLVGAITALAALDYLGFGLPALTPSLGQLLHQAQTNRSAWWLILYPSLALFIVMLLTVFIGEGIREAYDPRPRTRME